MGKLYQYLAISLLTTVLGFFAGLFFVPASLVAIANSILAVALLIMLVVAFVMKLVKRNASGPLRFPIWVVYLFTFIEGILLYPTLMYYASSLGIALFLEVVLGTMVIFGVLAFLGQNQKSGSFVGLGKVLFVALIVLIIVSAVNVFLGIDSLGMAISVGGIVIFSLYILVDTNQAKTAYECGYLQDSSDYSIFVLNIYLDIINLLLDLLDLVNRIKND